MSKKLSLGPSHVFKCVSVTQIAREVQNYRISEFELHCARNCLELTEEKRAINQV